MGIAIHDFYCPECHRSVTLRGPSDSKSFQCPHCKTLIVTEGDPVNKILRHVDASDGGELSTMEQVNHFGLHVFWCLVLAGLMFCAGAIVGRAVLRYQLRNQALAPVTAEQSAEHVHGFGLWDRPLIWSEFHQAYTQGRSCTNCGWSELRRVPLPEKQ